MYWNRVYIVSVPLLLIIIHFFHSCCNKLDLAVLSFSSRLSRCLLAVSSSSFLVWRSRSSRWFFRRSCLSASSEVSAASAAVLYRTTWEQKFIFLIARFKSWRNGWLYQQGQLRKRQAMSRGTDWQMESTNYRIVDRSNVGEMSWKSKDLFSKMWSKMKRSKRWVSNILI